MHCFIQLPPEIIVLIMQGVKSNIDLQALVQGIPELLSIQLVKEYVGVRESLHVEQCKHGLVSIQGWEDWGSFTTIVVTNSKTCSKSKSHRRLQYFSMDVLIGMKHLKKLHVEHNDGLSIIHLLRYIPETLEILEIVIPKAIKHKHQFVPPEIFPFCSSRLLNLKLVTVINKSKYNRKSILKLTGFSAKRASIEVRGGGETEQKIIEEQGWTNLGIKNKNVLFKLGWALGSIIRQSSHHIQNIGIFGIDAIWIFQKPVMAEFHSYPNLRIIKVGGESLARSVVWSKHLMPHPEDRREFAYGMNLKPLVVVFSALFNNKCKIIYGDTKKAVLIGGNGVDLFKKYTFL